MACADELRLIARVARMYYEWQMRQAEIATQLGLSQATISRLLDRARKEGVIRFSVNIPEGVHANLEEMLIQKFDLRDAILVDSMSYDIEKTIQKEVGSAAAYYLENVFRQNEVIGLSSWSATLIAVVDAMRPVTKRSNIQVVQILGGVGMVSAQVQASHLANRFAKLVNGKTVFLPVPGVVGSDAALNVLLEDENVRSVFDLFPQVTTGLVGIGAIEPSDLLAASGNIYTENEFNLLRDKGALGDILLHFYDRDGKPIEGLLNSGVVSMSLTQLQKVDRAVGVAGGRRKYAAILGAMRGKLINILITDNFTAEHLCQEGRGD